MKRSKVENKIEYKIGWLRGFFDGEGGLQYAVYKTSLQWQTTKRIAVSNTDKENIDKVKKYLKSLKIDFREGNYKKGDKVKPITVIYIERKDAIKKYAKIIGFTEKRKVDKLNIILKSFDDRHRPTKEEIEELYVNKKMVAPEIAKRFGFTNASAIEWMKKFGIKRRSRSEQTKLFWERRRLII